MPKILRSIYVDVDQLRRLKKLSDDTRVPQAVYIREGIEDALTKYEGRNRYGPKESE